MRKAVLDAVPGSSEPAWTRTVLLSDDGLVFIAAALAGNEKSVAACAAFDGVPTVKIGTHIYLPTTWIAKDYPACSDLCSKAEQVARSAGGA
ncbi:hypothetical protein [Pseudoxanthomonas mexicana]